MQCPAGVPSPGIFSKVQRVFDGKVERGADTVKKRDHLGTLKPRYSFVLNPWVDVRLSKCPRCQRLTHLRKFALFIHLDGWGPLILGKTCRYCTPCEIVIAHRDELEAELAQTPARFVPATPGSGYLVVGTVDLKTWRKRLTDSGTGMEEILEHLADFKQHLTLRVEGGWMPARKSRGQAQ
jgi:hypothetical protein